MLLFLLLRFWYAIDGMVVAIAVARAFLIVGAIVDSCLSL